MDRLLYAYVVLMPWHRLGARLSMSNYGSNTSTVHVPTKFKARGSPKWPRALWSECLPINAYI